MLNYQRVPNPVEHVRHSSMFFVVIDVIGSTWRDLSPFLDAQNLGNPYWEMVIHSYRAIGIYRDLYTTY